jgi:hypothetical protein
MAVVYEDNFGYWDIDGPEEHAFFEHVQQQSANTICERCERPVQLMASKTFCARCVCALECGAPASMSQYSRDSSAERNAPVIRTDDESNLADNVILTLPQGKKHIIKLDDRERITVPQSLASAGDPPALPGWQ